MYTKLVIDTKDMLLNKPSFELSKNYKKSKLSKKKKKWKKVFRNKKQKDININQKDIVTNKEIQYTEQIKDIEY